MLFALCLILTNEVQLLAENYNVRFSDADGHNVTEAYAGDVVHAVLYTTGLQTNQEREIYNFNSDMSDVEFLNATYVEDSLTNRLDPSGSAPTTIGFLKPFEFREGGRVSLTSEIRFQFVAVLDDDQVASTASVKCRSNSFNLQDPGSVTRKGNKEKDFYLFVRRAFAPPLPPSSDERWMVLIIVMSIVGFVATVSGAVYYYVSSM